ncbi:hypothetical protein, partial [Agrobacterium sp.]|uniref:hypothetical protein n=1 Tax=Agrobacterium sp. TaxID=361 RepID=UPI0028A63CF5
DVIGFKRLKSFMQIVLVVLISRSQGALAVKMGYPLQCPDGCHHTQLTVLAAHRGDERIAAFKVPALRVRFS